MAKNSAKTAGSAKPATPVAAAVVDGNSTKNKRKREDKLLEKTNKKEKVDESEDEDEDEDDEEENDDDDEDDDEDESEGEKKESKDEQKEQQDLPAIDFSANDAASPAGKVSHPSCSKRSNRILSLHLPFVSTYFQSF